MARTRQSDDMALVKVAKTGAAVKEVALNGDRSVQAALDIAGFKAEGHRIRVNGKEATASKTLKDGDIVTLTGNIKGGQA